MSLDRSTFLKAPNRFERSLTQGDKHFKLEELFINKTLVIKGNGSTSRCIT